MPLQVEPELLTTSHMLIVSCMASWTLMQVAPGVTPTLIERLVQARSDLSKQDQKEVMEECRDVFANRQRALGDDGVAAAKGKTNLVPFKVGLCWQPALGPSLWHCGRQNT